MVTKEVRLVATFASSSSFLFTFCSNCINLISCFPLFSLQTLVDICRLLPQTKMPELVVSLVGLAVLIVVKEINACYRQKLPLPIPIELIVVSITFAFIVYSSVFIQTAGARYINDAYTQKPCV